MVAEGGGPLRSCAKPQLARTAAMQFAVHCIIQCQRNRLKHFASYQWQPGSVAGSSRCERGEGAVSFAC